MMPSSKKTTTIILFAKSPEGDGVKTRLSPALSVEKRLELHKAMLQWSFQQAMLSKADKVIVAIDGNHNNIFFENLFDQTKNNIQPINFDFRSFNKKKYSFIKQHEGDLGHKMLLAVNDELKASLSDKAVILIGSDCPFITPEYIDAAMLALDESPFVVGPASDGGYVLLGMKETLPSIFIDIPWGTEEVLKKTCDVLLSEEKAYETLKMLDDIDRPEDIDLLVTYKNKSVLFEDFFNGLNWQD
ncbi:MAG: TIGR04282 family arsenosugar biosynthesis glycosyltransferase [Cellvibrionaceae bacterium]